MKTSLALLIFSFSLSLNLVGEADLIRFDIVPSKGKSVMLKLYSSPDTASQMLNSIFYFSYRNSRQLLPAFDSVNLKTSDFSPLFLNNFGNYIHVYFQCKQMLGEWYEVVVNEETQKSMWIHADNLCYQLSWKEFKKQNKQIVIECNAIEKIEFHKKSKQTSSIIPHNNENCFAVMKIKGDWMLIDNLCEHCWGRSESKKRQKGWIRFKDNSSLKIKIIMIY